MTPGRDRGPESPRIPSARVERQVKEASSKPACRGDHRDLRVNRSGSELAEVVQSELRFEAALHLCVEALRRVAEYRLDDAVNDRMRQLGERKEFLRAYPKTIGDWLILRSLRSKMCLSPSLSRFWDRLLLKKNTQN